MPAGISVVICCFNSSSRITPTLEHIVNQKNISLAEWELIIIDNASTDNTAEKVKEIWNSFTSVKPELKIIYEPIPGLSAARKSGIENAYFDYILFCDDDNWLNEDYVSTSLQVMVSNRRIGALGGTGIPEFEYKEPPYFWVNQFHLLAVGPQTSVEGDITNGRGVLYGAGMVLNKAAFLHLQNNYQFQFLLSDRVKNSLQSSGDHELCLALKRAGYKIFYANKLQFRHFIPNQRTSIHYYKKLLFGFGVSYAQLHVYNITRKNVNNFKNDYRYNCLRSVKKILSAFVMLVLKGYYFDWNKYKYIDQLHELYSNLGVLSTFLKIKNAYKEQFYKNPLFSSTIHT